MKKLCFAVLTAAMFFGFASAASAVIAVAPGGQGDALLGELYRVEYDGGYVTFFDIANTSDQYVEIHVRLRSGRHSIEVWDKQYILTPHDKIWFQVESDADGQGFIWGEEIHEDGWPLSTALLDDVCFQSAAVIETTIGHIEVFGIGQGLNGQPGNLVNDVQNVLMGHVYLGSFETGEYLAYKMLAFSDFRTETTNLHRDLSTLGYIDKEISADYGGTIGPVNPYNQPDWATTHGPSWNDGDDLDGSGAAADPSSMWSLDEVEDALAKELIKSDYFNRAHSSNEGLTTTLAVVTFPAKYLHYNFAFWDDEIDDDATAKATRSSVNSVGVCDIMTEPGGVEITARLWNMDEYEFKVSPSETPPLPWEVNLIPVGDLSQDRFPVDPWFLGYYEFPFNAPSTGYEEYPMGWFLIDFEDEAANDARGVGIYPGENLMMHYEDINYPHARGFEWHWDPLLP